MSALENLSERDRAVLRSIFDPTATIADVCEEGDQFVEDEGVDIGAGFRIKGIDHIVYLNFTEEVTDSEKDSKSLCLQGVQMAEAGNLEEALVLLNKGIAAAPNRASAYNDRAQLYRLMKRDDDAMQDLSRVLQLTEGKKTRARAQAYCQRGMLLRKLGDDDSARLYFQEAAKLGSSFAKKQVIELNPYAALCNQMLSQVMRGEKNIKL